MEPIEAALRRRSELAHDETAAALVELLRADHVSSDAAGAGPSDPGAVGAGALDLLAAVFALDELETSLLLIAASVELDPRFGAVVGLLLGNPDRVRPTVGLALELCGRGSSSADARRLLGPTAALRHHRLLAVDGAAPMPLRDLRVPDRVVGHLLDDASIEETLATLTVEVAGRTDDGSAALARAFDAGVRLGHVRSAPGTAGLACAGGAFDQLEIGTLAIDLGRRSRRADPVELVALAVREAGLRGAGLLLAGADDEVRDDRTLLATLEGAAVPVVVVDDVAWGPEWVRGPLLTVTATELTRPERAEIWASALSDRPEGASTGRDETVPWSDLLSLRMTPEEISAVVRTAAVDSVAAGEPPSVARLRRAARSHRAVDVEQSAHRVVPRATLSDLVLPPTTRRSVEELVAWARHRETLLGHGQLAGKGSKGHGLTALFTGAPGTGKTLAAEAIAGELGLELCTVDLSAVVDKYIGETEKNLEKVISAAETLNVVLFFDEADALFGSRAAVGDARDRYANQEVSYLLQRIERFQGLALMATNFRGNIDAAFTRRLHHVVDFAEPDEATRRLLWLAHLQEVPVLDANDPIDVDWLARHVELPGGNVRSIVLAATFLASEHISGLDAGPVGMAHVVRAVAREFQKLGRRPPQLPTSAAGAGAERTRENAS
ncbi:ATP-binding protein [Nocardioides sp. C4-1]|uniref:ATP-binding protein n=1 Tax=Nocardioides sp. C4-1 TaxID=3151851 RepID=UPI003263B03B